MSTTRFARVLVITCIIGSALVSLSTPGLSREKSSSRCPRFKPVEPKSVSEQKGEAPKAKMLAVGDAATKDDPLVLELDFGLAFWLFDPTGDPNDPDSVIPVIEDTQFFNLQVASAREKVRLNANLVWEDPWQVKDLDEIVYNSRGEEVAGSFYGLNCCPLNGPEELAVLPARNCEGFTLEVRAFRTVPSTAATLRIWLQ